MFNTPPTDAPVTAPEGQGENWEQRFKGLQREYNKRQTELEAAAARATDAAGALGGAAGADPHRSHGGLVNGRPDPDRTGSGSGSRH